MLLNSFLRPPILPIPRPQPVGPRRVSVLPATTLREPALLRLIDLRSSADTRYRAFRYRVARDKAYKTDWGDLLGPLNRKQQRGAGRLMPRVHKRFSMLDP